MSLNWTPNATGFARCGAEAWSLTMVNTNPIDLAIFTENFVPLTKTLAIYSTDVAKAGFYDFLVTVFYAVQPLVKSTTQFQIEVIECKTGTLSVDAAIWVNDNYYIYGAAKTLTWNPAATGIPECGPVSWSLTMVNSNPIDGSVFVEDFT